MQKMQMLSGTPLRTVVPLRSSTSAEGWKSSDLALPQDFIALHDDIMRQLNIFNSATEDQIAESARQFIGAERTHLRDSEVITLWVAALGRKAGKPIGCSDVLAFGALNGSTLSSAAVFKALNDLALMGFLKRIEAEHKVELQRPREKIFELTSFGMVALELAATYEKHLRSAA